VIDRFLLAPERRFEKKERIRNKLPSYHKNHRQAPSLLNRPLRFLVAAGIKPCKKDKKPILP
jgi:hypothetical protein